MKIYVSGSWDGKERLRQIAHRLTEMGHIVTSSWVNETNRPAHLTQGQWYALLADKDTAEVVASDCIIMDLDEPSTTGGRYTEWGLAIHPSSVMLRYTVGGGTKARIFTHKAHEHYDTWGQLLAEFPRAS